MTSLSFYSSFWRRKWQPIPMFLPGESHGQRGLLCCGLWGCTKSDMTRQLTHTHNIIKLGSCYHHSFKHEGKNQLKGVKCKYQIDGKESACNAGDWGSIPGSGRSLGGGSGHLLQYSCLENSTDRGAWWATVHRVTKSWTRLSN